MEILAHAQELIYQLIETIPSPYQKQSFKALLELSLKADGVSVPEHCKLKSASALSRFLNHYSWSVRRIICCVRQAVRKRLSTYRPRGRRPHLQVMLDLTTLEKRGKFSGFESLVSVFNGKRGMHLVVLYLVVGQWRVPWSFRVYRGKGTRSQAELGLQLVRQLPHWLRQRFRVIVLADTAFGSVDWLVGIRALKLHAIVGVRYDRTLTDGRHLFDLHKPGQQVRLQGLSFPVTVAWFYLKRDGEQKRSKRYVISSRPLKAATIVWWGRHRWQIESFFKTAKHRFGLHRFGQKSLLGVYRWLVVSLIAFVLAHWGYLSLDVESLPDWGLAAQVIVEACFADVVIALLIAEVERKQPLLEDMGWKVHIERCKI